MSAAAPKPRLKTSAMIASIAGEGQITRSAPFGHALVELARNRPEVMGMTADLGKYTDLHLFAKEYPERYYQMGMAEQLFAPTIPTGKAATASFCRTAITRLRCTRR